MRKKQQDREWESESSSSSSNNKLPHVDQQPVAEEAARKQRALWRLCKQRREQRAAGHTSDRQQSDRQRAWLLAWPHISQSWGPLNFCTTAVVGRGGRALVGVHKLAGQTGKQTLLTSHKMTASQWQIVPNRNGKQNAKQQHWPGRGRSNGQGSVTPTPMPTNMQILRTAVNLLSEQKARKKQEKAKTIWATIERSV